MFSKKEWHNLPNINEHKGMYGVLEVLFLGKIHSICLEQKSIRTWTLLCYVATSMAVVKDNFPLLTVLVDIDRHSWLERQEKHFGHTMAILAFFIQNYSILNRKSWKMTIVIRLKLLKINRAPAFCIHQYGNENQKHACLQDFEFSFKH